MLVGMMPMGGPGSRLGLPFNKGLAPTFVDGKIVPLYRHVYERMQLVGVEETYFILSNEQASDKTLYTLPGKRLFFEPGYASSVGAAAATLDPQDLVCFGLPDTIWYPHSGYGKLYSSWRLDPKLDGVLGLFGGSSIELDEVKLSATGTVRSIRYHDPEDAVPRRVYGWGCFIIRAGKLALLENGLVGPQLAQFHLGGLLLEGPYYDLGTPERYLKHHVIS